jgi:hypothetical protein
MRRAPDQHLLAIGLRWGYHHRLRRPAALLLWTAVALAVASLAVRAIALRFLIGFGGCHPNPADFYNVAADSSNLPFLDGVVTHTLADDAGAAPTKPRHSENSSGAPRWERT